MQQRAKRFYITQDEDQAVVRSVPIARPQAKLSTDELVPVQPVEQQATDGEQDGVAKRVRSVVRRGAAAAGRR